MSAPQLSGAPSFLLFGYGGANNTGADARLATIVADVRAAVGPETRISVATVNPAMTRRCITEDEHLHIVGLPYVFPFAVLRLVAKHDVLMLVEGSTFKQNWSRALLYAFLWGALCSRLLRKSCIAYAVDAGKLDGLNAFFTRHACNSMQLLILRTGFAAQRLRELGVQREMHVNTDTAFSFISSEAAPLPIVAPGTRWLGLAPVEFYQWPVRVRLLGPASECYHWPYYFTWNRARRRASAELVNTWAELAIEGRRTHGLDPVLIAMEQLDDAICTKVADRCEQLGTHRPVIVSARSLPPARMISLLRRLDCLVTSRYHACVLSMAGPVPQMAIAHDERLEDIYTEMGLKDRFLLRHHDPDLRARSKAMLLTLWREREQHRDRLGELHEKLFLPRCLANRKLLADFVSREYHWSTPPANGVASSPMGMETHAGH